MASLDERVAYLERRMEDHYALMVDIRTELRAFRGAVEQRFEQIDRRFERIDQRFEHMDQTFDGRLDRLDQKIDRQFMWLMGILVGVVLGLVGLAFQVAGLQPS